MNSAVNQVFVGEGYQQAASPFEEIRIWHRSRDHALVYLKEPDQLTVYAIPFTGRASSWSYPRLSEREIVERGLLTEDAVVFLRLQGINIRS